MSRAQNLFKNKDLSARADYSKYISKEVYVKASFASHSRIFWVRGLMLVPDDECIRIVVYGTNSPFSLDVKLRIPYPDVITIQLAGGNIYDEIMRR